METPQPTNQHWNDYDGIFRFGDIAQDAHDTPLAGSVGSAALEFYVEGTLDAHQDALTAAEASTQLVFSSDIEAESPAFAPKPHHQGVFSHS